jgi:hypothetical protein
MGECKSKRLLLITGNSQPPNAEPNAILIDISLRTAGIMKMV